jgi:hypothetical protein
MRRLLKRLAGSFMRQGHARGNSLRFAAVLSGNALKQAAAA